MLSASLGYPRIGANREWKKALESYWAGGITESELHAELRGIRLGSLKVQQSYGIDVIPVGDFTYYDHILDTAVMFGLVPGRFGWDGVQVDLPLYFAMARGNKGAAACEMTKWFNTNYHYIVPELKGLTPKLTRNRLVDAYREGKQELGIEGRPVLVGLYTFLKLSKGYTPEELPGWIDALLPLYGQVLRELAEEGAAWVQIDEPILSTTLGADDLSHIARIYAELGRLAPGIRILVQTYFEAVDHYAEVVKLPVDGIGLDFVHDGGGRNLQAVEAHGFPAGKVLGAGIIDGRGIWRVDLHERFDLLGRLRQVVLDEQLIVQPSNSLLHVPVSAEREAALDPALRGALAFANEKLEELALLVRGAKHGIESITEECVASVWNREALGRIRGGAASGAAGVSALGPEQFARPSAFAERLVKQQQRWQLPLLPTTTIGSFPQTPEVRSARFKWRKGEWSAEQYGQFIQVEIQSWIDIQTKLGLDVFVHGEFERTDMVEFFGEKLAGFAFTAGGWVQSYGSRCVKPPIIYGDVAFTAQMTVQETVYAQSLTEKPVKGMLTGPITILNWSFVRDDLSREEVAYQIALAIRKEVEALEAAGIGMIQVDEPAIREGLPLKRENWPAYLNWAVRAFRLATSTVQDETQIHTHMCYSEFGEIMEAIHALDADVISIETSRSHGELISSFEERTYDKGIGLGVYDIHSPRVPTVDEMSGMIDRALRVLAPEQFWINPDCGLKTRKAEETIAALRNMIDATVQARAKYGAAAAVQK